MGFSSKTPRPEPGTISRRLQEIDLFFEKRGKEHQAPRRLVKNLEQAGIPYALVGGMAVNFHRHVRTTEGIDILLSAAGFKEFCDRLVPGEYEHVANKPRRFLDRKQGVTIDVLITGRFPGSGQPGPIAYPEPTNVSQRIEDAMVVDLAALITLKLAAHRYQDFGDVVALIRANDLDETFMDRLHPSLHRDFLRCLDEKQREEAYEAREADDE